MLIGDPVLGAGLQIRSGRFIPKGAVMALLKHFETVPSCSNEPFDPAKEKASPNDEAKETKALSKLSYHVPEISSSPCLRLPMRSLSQSFSGRSVGNGMRSIVHSCSNLVLMATSMLNSSRPSSIIFGSSSVRKVPFRQEKVAIADKFFSSSLAFRFAKVDTY